MDFNVVLKWMAGVAAALLCAAIIAVWNLVRDKANKNDVATEFKAINSRMDQAILAIGLSVSKVDFNKDLGSAATRADDKRVRIEQDIAELKSDMKVTVEKVVLVDKKLDELPTRVASLEASRRENSK